MNYHWYNVEEKPAVALNRDWEAECKWAKNTGYTKHLSIGAMPWDLPRFLSNKHRRPKNGVELPVSLDHLTIYCNPKTNERVALFHEYPEAAKYKMPILEQWAESNGLTIKPMDYSWYYPGVTLAYQIKANKEKTQNDPAYRARVKNRLRSAANLLQKLGCQINYPENFNYESAADELISSVKRRKRIDWDD